MKKTVFILTTLLILMLTGCGIFGNRPTNGDSLFSKTNVPIEQEDIDISSTYLVGFDYSSYADVYGMAPVIICKIRYDKKLEANFKWDDDSATEHEEVMTFDFTDEQFANIQGGVDAKEIYYLDPECADPEDVCDGSSAYLIIYGPNDDKLKSCGGFCPVSKRFNEIRRLLYNNLPSDFIDTYTFFEEHGYVGEENVNGDGTTTPTDTVTVIGEVFTYAITPISIRDDGLVNEWEIVVTNDNGMIQTIETTIDEYSIFYPYAEDLLHEEDVNFDGDIDLIIYHGTVGAQGNMISECYINCGDSLEKCLGFEEIPDYYVDTDAEVIHGAARDGAAAYYEYFYVVRDNEAVLIETNRYVYNPETEDYEIEK